MKFTPDDPRLTRYLLGELSPKEAEALENAMAKQPELRAALVELNDTQNFLGSQLIVPELKLQPAQKRRIFEAAAQQALERLPSPRLRSFTPYLLPLAAAALFVMVVMIKRPNVARPAGSRSPNVAKAPEPILAPISPAAAARPRSVFLEHRSALAREIPALVLPAQIGNASYELISQSIRGERRLPPPASVRLEEILNQFTFRLDGMIAIARSTSIHWHPDARDASLAPPTAMLAAELVACPWKPSSSLLIVALKGNSKSKVAVNLRYQANPDTVASYRLLGFDPVPDQPAAAPTTELDRAAASSLVVEISSVNSGTELGLLQWSTEGKVAPSISLSRKADAEPSDDARFAALVCTYAKWLAGDEPTLIDADLVAALAREVASSTLPADREDFLNLVDQSLSLAERK
jgi:hypothetical protein